MESKTFTIDTLQPQTEAVAFCEMFESVYGHPMDLDTWDWKYRQSPGGQGIQLVASAVGSKQLIGHVGAVILPGCISAPDGAPLLWAQIGDVMVRDHARGDLRSNGVYRQLMRRLQQELSLLSQTQGIPLFAYGFPGERPFRLGERLGYYRALYRCQQWTYNSSASKPKLRWQWPLRRPLRVWLHSETMPLQIADTIWQTLMRVPGPIKNAAYLRWRYTQHPKQHYRIWWVGRDSKNPQGWFVTDQPSSAETPLLIVDSLVASTDWEEALSSLMSCHSGRMLQGWLSSSFGNSKLTPIVAIEIGTPQFNSKFSSPIFQPGDTDVF